MYIYKYIYLYETLYYSIYSILNIYSMYSIYFIFIVFFLIIFSIKEISQNICSLYILILYILYKPLTARLSDYAKQCIKCFISISINNHNARGGFQSINHRSAENGRLALPSAHSQNNFSQFFLLANKIHKKQIIYLPPKPNLIP